jgi:hypothetical protein
MCQPSITGKKKCNFSAGRKFEAPTELTALNDELPYDLSANSPDMGQIQSL